MKKKRCTIPEVELTEERYRIIIFFVINGVLDASDIVLLQMYMFGESISADMEAGDMNDDGTINISDLCLIKAEIIDKNIL